MLITRKDIGYTVYSRLEEALRAAIATRMLAIFGSDWFAQIPGGIVEKVADRNSEATTDITTLLDETDFPDLAEIAGAKGVARAFFAGLPLSVAEFRQLMTSVYENRCKIAHVRRAFSALDLDALISAARALLPMLGPAGGELDTLLQCLESNPEEVVLHIPENFFIADDTPCFRYPNNLPPSDYDPDGGFIGRKEDVDRVTQLLLGDLYRVITVSGGGGVGKSAVAHRVCSSLLARDSFPFEGLVWVSAKEERLTVTGIEPVEPGFRNYEELVDSIIQTFGWREHQTLSREAKEALVEVVLRASDKGILLVIDNLETVRDERVKLFILNLPPPNKVLITSRMGLGEVERRFPLPAMKTQDAITLLRTVAREKAAPTFASLPDSVLGTYVDRMSRYPLAIKWVVGQVALGKAIDLALGDLTSSTGDVARFCFSHVFDCLLTEESRLVLFALAAYDEPLVRGVLAHVTNLNPEALEAALRELTIASLLIPTQQAKPDGTLETRYELLPLTCDYIHSRLQARPVIFEGIRSRIQMVRDLIEEADRAGKQYRYSLRDMGADSEEEKIAATLAMTGYHKYQAGDYDGAMQTFEKATQIAPTFAAIYRNWATVESEAGFSGKADELMKKATRLSPQDPRLWFVWGNIEKRRQRYDKAYEYLRKALDIAPKDSPILGALGEVEKRRGNFESAMGLLTAALTEGVHEAPKRRHEIVCYTSLADNMKRWAEALNKDRRPDEALFKLEAAYKYAQTAMELGKEDPRAQDTMREVSLDLAMQYAHAHQLERAKPYFEGAIVRNPRRAKEKRTTERACVHYAQALLSAGEKDEARRVLTLVKRTTLEGGGHAAHYQDLWLELCEERIRATLLRVSPGKGFGFVELLDGSGRTAFLHISQVIPKPSLDEFEALAGMCFEISLQQEPKGLAAKRARLVGTQ